MSTESDITQISVSLGKIETKMDAVEKRVGRIEMGFLAVFVASLVVLANQVLTTSGIPTP